MFQFTKYIRDGLPISRGMVVEIVAKRCLEDEMIFFLGMEWMFNVEYPQINLFLIEFW